MHTNINTLNLIFIISDFQTNTYQLGLLKQDLYNASNNTKIIDFYHNIRLNNINEAAFVLKQLRNDENQSFTAIAKVGAVDEYIVYQHLLNFYILPNNGLLSLLFGHIKNDNLYLVKSKEISLAYQYISENRIHELPKCTNFIKYLPKQFFERGDYLISECVHIDMHGNCYFNIDKESFYRFVGTGTFNVKVQHYSSVITQTISNNIAEIPQGIAGVYFIESGFLKLVVNMGNAQKLFRIKDNTQLIIEKL